MPAPPAELVAELTIETSPEGERSPQEQIEAGKRAAASTGLSREAGPETVILAGREPEVLEALPEVIQAALGGGARAISVRVEVPSEVRRKTQGDSRGDLHQGSERYG